MNKPLLCAALLAGAMHAQAAPPVYFFSDCQAGAEAGCVPGDNGNKGTSASAPKRDLRGVDVNRLPAGSQLLFARGGAWSNFRVSLRNIDLTPEQPLLFDSYEPPGGGKAAPLLKAGGGLAAFEFGTFNDTANDGGYTIRNLKLDGGGTVEWGFWLRNEVRNVTIDGVEITGFKIGVHSLSTGKHGNTFLTVRGSDIHHNLAMGLLGAADDMLIEGNIFRANNVSGSNRDHAIYLGSSERESKRITVRRNTFTDNSVVKGVCSGGNLTVHGRFDGLLVEGNTITQEASSGGCYGISITPAYASSEWFKNTVVRGNTLVNLGHCSICVASAPGVVIEDNVVVNTRATLQAAVTLPEFEPGPGDARDEGALIRNNTVYYAQPESGSAAVSLRAGAGAGVRVVSNLVVFGAGSASSHPCISRRGGEAQAENNLCRFAADKSGPDLQFTPPSKANQWRCAIGARSAALRAGHPASSSARAARLGGAGATPDIGACERSAP